MDSVDSLSQPVTQDTFESLTYHQVSHKGLEVGDSLFEQLEALRETEKSMIMIWTAQDSHRVSEVEDSSLFVTQTAQDNFKSHT